MDDVNPDERVERAWSVERRARERGRGRKRTNERSMHSAKGKNQSQSRGVERALKRFIVALVLGDVGIEIALHLGANLWGHSIVVQHAIEMIVFVLEHARFEAFERHLELFTLEVLRFDLYADRSLREGSARMRRRQSFESHANERTRDH